MFSRQATGDCVMQVATPRDGVAETLCLDPFDLLCLRLARHLFEQPESPQHPAWIEAHRTAREALAPHEAASVIQSLWRVIDILTDVRQSDFLFVRHDDPHAHLFITPDERTLVRLFHFLRIGGGAAAQTQLIMLCQGGDGRALMAEARKFSDVLRAQEAPVQQKT